MNLVLSFKLVNLSCNPILVQLFSRCLGQNQYCDLQKCNIPLADRIFPLSPKLWSRMHVCLRQICRYEKFRISSIVCHTETIEILIFFIPFAIKYRRSAKFGHSLNNESGIGSMRDLFQEV